MSVAPGFPCAFHVHVMANKIKVRLVVRQHVLSALAQPPTFLHNLHAQAHARMHTRTHARMHPCLCHLVISCCTRVTSKAAPAGAPDQGFDCIVVDPPWENASARRAAKYTTLPSRYLLSVPMRKLLNHVSSIQPRGMSGL